MPCSGHGTLGVIVVAIWLAGPANAQETLPDFHPDNPMLHQAGTKLVDGKGRVVQLRGVNLAGWMQWEGFLFGKGIFVSRTQMLNRLDQLIGPQETAAFREHIEANYITEADIRRIAELGFNSVRVNFNFRVLEDEGPPNAYKASGWALLDALIGWCEKYRVYAILDLHAAPGGQSNVPTADPGPSAGLLWRSEANRARTVALWKAIAGRYRDRLTVAGYDLLNEPVAGDGTALVELYTRIIRGIREVDPHHLVILEGNKLATDFGAFKQPLSGNQAYSFHIYTWFGDNRKKQLGALRELARRQRVPLWCGEFGENSHEMMRTTVAMFDEADPVMGWCFFTWKRAPTRYPGLVTVTIPAPWQQTINWIAWPLRAKPRKEVALTGIHEFTNAVLLDHGRLDTEMVNALLPGGRP